MTQDVGMV